VWIVPPLFVEQEWNGPGIKPFSNKSRIETLKEEGYTYSPSPMQGILLG